MKAFAYSYTYKPEMDEEIVDLVRNCSSCKEAAEMPPKQPNMLCLIPRQPWSRLHTDCTYNSAFMDASLRMVSRIFWHHHGPMTVVRSVRIARPNGVG